MSLARFIEAQDRIWPAPLEEIRAGRKVSHWMWFVWPQLRGLGRSATAKHYGIRDLEEAKAFVADPVLGARLAEMSLAMLEHAGLPPEDILGPIDAVKLQSCATLFEKADGGDVFAQLLEVFFSGRRCERTLGMIGAV